MANITINRTVSLDGPVLPEFMPGLLYMNENQAHQFVISCTRGGSAVTLTGGITGRFLRADGQTILLTGSISSGKGVLTLPQSCYIAPGRFVLSIFNTAGTVTTTIYAMTGNVARTQTDTLVDPGNTIPDIDELLAEVEAMRAATAAANAAAAGAAQYSDFINAFSGESARDSVTTVSSENGTYWNCEGDTAYKDTVSDTSFKAYDPVPVVAGEVYTIYNRSGATHKARPYLVTDDNLTILSSSGDQFREPTKLYTIVVPDGGTKLLLTSVNSGGPQLRKVDWSNTIDTSKAMKYRGAINVLGYTSLMQCEETGYYGCGASYNGNLTDLPVGFDTSAAITLFNFAYAFNSGASTPATDGWHLQFLVGSNGTMYRRRIYASDHYAYAWESMASGGGGGGGGGLTDLYGKNVAIIGDSISTNGNTGTLANVPEIKIQSADVGVTLRAYLTYHDVQAGLSLGGHTFTSSEIGTEVTFVPTSSDVGKVIGLPSNYNPSSTTTWWEVAAAALGFNAIPNCWSGASITSHEGGETEYKTSYAWHDASIRKCGIRQPGSMNRTAPDVIIIYRGTNDFSHSPYAKLTSGYFNNYNWSYPSSDAVSGGYGYKEGLCLTIKKLRQAYPDARIVLCTLNVFKRVNYAHYPTNNGTNSLPQYNDAIREVADFMGCGLIEFDKDGITFENCYSEGYITDSATTPTHPSDKGHRVMGIRAVVDLAYAYGTSTGGSSDADVATGDETRQYLNI